MDPIVIDARWDYDVGVWTATSRQVHGLVVEADGWSGMIDEVRLVLPDLLALNGLPGSNRTLTFRAEEHLDLEPA